MRTLAVWLTIIMFVAKIFNFMAVSWWIVFTPLMIYFAVWVVLMVLIFGVAILGAILDK